MNGARDQEPIHATKRGGNFVMRVGRHCKHDQQGTRKMEDAIVNESLPTMTLKIGANDLLYLNLDEGDPRMEIMARNSRESRLLNLPAEIRNKIFKLAIGGHHVHIEDNMDLSQTNPTHAKFEQNRQRNKMGLEKHMYLTFTNPIGVGTAGFYHHLYPLDWITYYEDNSFRYRLKPSYQFLANLPAVCRQIYDETNFIMYSHNEFSFQGKMVMNTWLAYRVPAQKQALTCLWVSWLRPRVNTPPDKWEIRNFLLIARDDLTGLKKMYVQLSEAEGAKKQFERILQSVFRAAGPKFEICFVD
ncbi:hypothetical protein P154DRAFT_524799 [Amniculicola lignicola CBS 123094]|uniref:DUF7730 domain-containing protein n=1 Tax=Amniculicola lignicola CBS 123094 TaxID=1392246 RepID=A0A6A5W9L2_9PLEO|nr:hypothetical protein P154DRAFT_524799 [Amniculicola lignicola CBS 123094]